MCCSGYQSDLDRLASFWLIFLWCRVASRMERRLEKVTCVTVFASQAQLPMDIANKLRRYIELRIQVQTVCQTHYLTGMP